MRGIMAACQKSKFVHLAAACQYMPAVANYLKEKGWNRSDVEGAIDFTGVDQCLRLLGEKHVLLLLGEVNVRSIL